jgi:hypothetical protein
MKLLLMGKHLFAAITALIFFVQASAQLEKGKLYTGVSSENRINFNNRSFGFKPELAYALDQHSSIGVKFNYFRSNKYNVHYLDNAKGYNVHFGIGVSYNYFRYFKNSNKLGWYVNANLEFNRRRFYDIKYSGQTVLNSQYKQAELSLRPGIFYSPSRNVMLFANFGGISLKRSNGDFYGDFNFASQFNIGVLINLDVFKKKKKNIIPPPTF